MQIETFPNKGRGIVTTCEFVKGEFVVEYAGELLSSIATAHQREELYADKDAGSYMYYFRHRERTWCVDATAETDRLGRLINHGKNGNNLRTRVVEVAGTPRLIFVATRKIAVGEELLYDYGERRPNVIESFPWLKA